MINVVIHYKKDSETSEWIDKKLELISEPQQGDVIGLGVFDSRDYHQVISRAYPDGEEGIALMLWCERVFLSEEGLFSKELT